MPKCIYKNLTSTGVVLAGEGWIEEMYVNSTTSGLIRLWASPSSAVNTGAPISGGYFSPTAGAHIFSGLHATAGVYMAKGSGTIDVTFLIREID